MTGAVRLRAAALDPETRGRVLAAPAAAGRVHSTFARAVNLLWHDGRLVTLHGPGRLRAPFALALEAWPAESGVSPHQPVERAGSRMSLGGMVVDVAAAETRDLRLQPAGSGPQALAWALAGVSPPPTAPGLASPAAEEELRRLRDGIRTRDAARLLDGARGLVGLGEGLTPAGDDCLVGVLAVLHAFAPALAQAPAIRAGIAEAAAGTTLVAREFLRSALDGRFAEVLVRLCSGAAGDAAATAQELFEVGGTSGADTLRGVQLALEALGEAAPPAPQRRHRFRT
ncbi:MAG: DUF2877 domain-containing protein [Candidatus Methylomirabilales bacterium]